MTATKAPLVEQAGSLADRASSAVQWRLAASVTAGVFQFAIGVLLARLLTPGDFGLVALAFVVLGFVNLFGDLGIGAALVQRATISSRYIRASFTFSCAFGLAVAAIVYVAAPLGGAFMRDQALTPVLRALSAGFALDGIAVTARALLRRRLDFRMLFVIDLSSYLIGYAGIGVTLALLHRGVWSLVCAGLAQSAIAAALALGLVRHSLRPLVARSELKNLLHFGVGVSASGFVNYVATNGDNFAVGRLLGPAALGLYSRAYSLMNLPQTYTASVMSGVLFPAFAQVQDDRARFQRGYLLASRVTALSAAPIMAGLAVAAPHVIAALYGPGWERTVVPLQILCLAGYFRALYHLGGSVAQASGRVYRELRAQLGYAVLVVVGSLLAIRYGIAGVAVAVTLAIMYMYWAMAHIALQTTALSWRRYVAAQLPGFRLGVAVGVCALGVRLALEMNDVASGWIALALLGSCGIVWVSGLIFALRDPDLQVVAKHLPVRFRAISIVPTRVHDVMRRVDPFTIRAR